MLEDDAFQWFEDHGGLTRANGDRLRQMVLSRGNTEDLGNMYKAWLGSEPSIEPMLKYPRPDPGWNEVSGCEVSFCRAGYDKVRMNMIRKNR